MKKAFSKSLSWLLSVAIMFGFIVVSLPIEVFAQSRTYNFSNNYTLTGNGAIDMVNIAKAQLGKTGSDLGYSEEWCADFVSDCAILANQTAAIPGSPRCSVLRPNIKEAGGNYVDFDEAQAGDIAFYANDNHVEIVYAAYNGKISTYGGNSGDGGNCYARSVRDHATQGQKIAYIIRPNYSGVPNSFPGDIDYSYAVPVSLVADHQCDTYNSAGNKEYGHYISPGDNCYIETVYTNGFCYVEYDLDGGGTREAYAWAGDFPIPKKVNKPSATYVSVSAGTNFSPTSFWWNASENVDHYDLKIWNGTYWDGDAYKIEWDIRDTSCSLQLPAGYYEAYVDSVNSEGCTMSENVVRFTVDDENVVDVGDNFYAVIKNAKYNNYISKVNDTDNIYLQDENNTSKQVWFFEKQDDNAYVITSCYDGKVLEMTNGERENAVHITAHDNFWGGYYQQWYLVDCGSGYRLLNKHYVSEHWYLDRSNNGDSNGNKVQIFQKAVDDDQIWVIDKESAIADLGKNFYATISNTKSGGFVSKVDGTNDIYLQEKNNTSKQVWYFEQQDDGAYAISSYYDGKYLEMSSGTRENKTRITAPNDFWGGYYQQWYLIPYGNGFEILCKHFTSEGWYLDKSVNSDNNGNYIQIYEKFWNSDDQVWTIEKLADIGTDFYAYIINTSAQKMVTVIDDNVQLQTDTGQANQVWYFERQNDLSYKISSAATSNCLDVYGYEKSNGTNIFAGCSNDQDNQRWYFTEKDGNYVIHPKHAPNMAFDVNGASTEDGANIQIWETNGTSAQDFNIRYLGIPKSATLYVFEGNNYKPTRFFWDNTDNTLYYNIKVYKDTVLDGELVASGTNLTEEFYSVNLPNGYYEAYVDSCNTFTHTMSGNVVKFTITESTPEVIDTNFYAYIVNTATNSYLINDNGNVCFNKTNSINENQKVWYFTKNENDSFTIKSMYDDKVLDVYMDKDENGTNVQTFNQGENYANQQWYFQGVSPYYYIKPAFTDRVVLDLNGGEYYDNVNAQVWEKNGTDAQKFKLVKVNYSISYNMNGGNGSIGNQTKTYGQDLTLSSTIPTRTDYKFIGWNTDKNANSAQYQPGDKYTANSGATLYAIWTINHDYTTKVFAPTCTAKGYTLHTCKDCKDSYKE